jgi:hypothetical protein
MKKQYQMLLIGWLVCLWGLVGCGLNEPAATLPPPPTPPGGTRPSAIVTEGIATLPPDDGARQTAVAQSSPTPATIATPTLAPTATPATQPADPRATAVSAANLPATSHDLLLIADGELKRWNHNSRQIETLLSRDNTLQPDPDTGIGDTIAYSLRADGRRAVVGRLTATTTISDTVTPGAIITINTYELRYLNLETGAAQPLVTAVTDTNRPAFSLSPDGRYLAFSGLALGAANPMPDQATDEQLFVLETESGQTPRIVGQCRGSCTAMRWHQDNNFFVFGDRQGLWLYNLSASRPELLLDGGQGDAGFGVYVEPIAWGRNGRYLLMWYGGGIEGAERAVFDVPTKTRLIVPNSFVYADPLYAEMTWMQDDRLFIVRSEGGQALGETWRVNLDAGQIQRDESVILSSQLEHPTAPVHWPNGHFGYGLLDANDAASSGLYRRVAFTEPEAQLNVLPAATYAPEIAWLPDGSGAAIAHDGRLYYAPTDGALYDLSTAVGPNAHTLTWLNGQ